MVDGQVYEGAATSMAARHAAETHGAQRIRISSVPLATLAAADQGIEQMTFTVRGDATVEIKELSVQPRSDESLQVENGFDLRYLTASAPQDVAVTVNLGRTVPLAEAASAQQAKGTVAASYATLVVDVTYVGGQTGHVETPLCFEGMGSDEVLIMRDPRAALNGPLVKCDR